MIRLLLIIFVASAVALLALLAANNHIRSTAAQRIDTTGTVIQQRNNSCGPAALAMLLRARGIDVTEEELMRRVEMSANGTSMLELRRAAAAYGVALDGWLLRYDDLRTAAAPAVLFIDRRHFVLFDSVGSDGTVFLRDPALGRRSMTRKEFLRSWNGESLVLQAPDMY